MDLLYIYFLNLYSIFYEKQQLSKQSECEIMKTVRFTDHSVIER